MQVTSPGASAGKAEWRRWFRKNLAAIAEPDVQSEAVRHHLNVLLSREPASCIATFSALEDEPSILELLPSFPDHRWVLPRVADNELVFHHVNRLDQLKPGAYGIAEPTPDLAVVPTEEIDIFLCPGLGFDQTGIRLGRGKGFYDRALSEAKKDADRIGIAFREQIVEQLPADSHDVSMTRLVSPDRSSVIS